MASLRSELRHRWSSLVAHRVGPARYAYLELHAFELALAVASVMASVAFFTDPDSFAKTSVAVAGRGFSLSWNALMGVGAGMVVYGLWRMKPIIEVSGLFFYSAAMLANAAAIAIVHHRAGAIAVGTYTGIAVAAGCRIRQVITDGR